jgi:hypothetical protein
MNIWPVNVNQTCWALREESRRSTTVSNHLTVDTDGLPVRETKLSASPGTHTLTPKEANFQTETWNARQETNSERNLGGGRKKKSKEKGLETCAIFSLGNSFRITRVELGFHTQPSLTGGRVGGKKEGEPRWGDELHCFFYQEGG